MKKVLLLFSLFLSLNAFSQVRLGLNFNPGFLINRVDNPGQPDSLSYSRNGLGFKFTAGPDIHVMFSDNYGMTFGVWYAAKRVGVKTTNTKTGFETKDNYNLQYVQLPVTLRMYTNEIATNLKLYFQVGGTFDIQLATKDKKINFDPINKFGRFDSNILAGAGVEMDLGSTTVFGGIRYMRSLINNVSKVRIKDGDKVKINSDLISLDLGIKF